MRWVIACRLISCQNKVRLLGCLCYTADVNREESWSHYFLTGDMEPLLLAYRDGVHRIVCGWYTRNREDMMQWGMMGVIKAARAIDPKRVKSKDAWVWLNVKGMLLNNAKKHLYIDADSLHEEIAEDLTLADTIGVEYDLDAKIDIERGNLHGYAPSVVSEKKIINQYENGKLSIRGVSRELGISRRKACKLVGVAYI